MSRLESAIGMALMCDEHGVIRKVLQNVFDLKDSDLVGRQLPAVFGKSSLHKSLSFLFELKRHGWFFDCELDLPVRNRVAFIHCAGLAFGDGFLIVAAESRLSVQDLFEGMVRINNDQSNLLRHTAKEHAELASSIPERGFDMLDQLTSTNNELVSLQRELHQKNAQLERLNAEIQSLARVDELTSLFNRRGLFEMGHREVALSKRFNKPLAAIMLDIDHFKTFNDTYGHAIGDEVLRGVAERCVEELREVDIFGRYGGEEFSVLLPESDSQAALTTAERLRSVIDESAFETERGSLPVTISLGIATLNDQTDSLEDLLELADRALYKAKETGRNRVCVYQAAP